MNTPTVPTSTADNATQPEADTSERALRIAIAYCDEAIQGNGDIVMATSHLVELLKSDGDKVSEVNAELLSCLQELVAGHDAYPAIKNLPELPRWTRARVVMHKAEGRQ